MADKDATEIDEHPQLLVRDLERDQRVARMLRIEVSGCATQRTCVSVVLTNAIGTPSGLTSNARELGEVIHDRFARVDVVVDEGNPRLDALAAKNRHAREDLSRRSEDLLRPVRVEVGFLLLQRDKLGVDRDQGPLSG